ncbi:MAG: holo-[acyl-carrier-protein] synthase [candidate division Zixibacteria bacterium HGW-Zixibacteria-1]|nr:MAG: holo-[acyl-carrier-protein] synthase [candidate division Zixibacteria bacterium HGW-Zixibacteria-1]
MIYSVGIDLIEIDRVRKALGQWGERFARRVLGEEERILYREKQNKVQFLAGRFAAKEAVMKALGTFLDSGVHLRDIQILNDLYGKPYVHLEDNVRERILDKEVKVSITHERKMAAAVAIITGD